MPQVGRSVRFLFSLIGACLLAVCAYAGAKIPPPLDTATSHAEAVNLLRHAETYYWLGIAEGGNLAAFEEVLRYVDKAAHLIGEDARAAALRSDLQAQLDMASDSVNGIFPLMMTSRVLRFAAFAPTTTYEVLEEPDNAAVTGAASRLADAVIEKWPFRPQFDVIFTSTPHRIDLENEVLSIFHGSPKFLVHNRRELGDVFPDGVPVALQRGQPELESVKAICDRFATDRVFQVHIEAIDSIDGVERYAVHARLLNATQASPEASMSVVGIARDKRPALLEAFSAVAVLMLLVWLISLSWLTAPRIRLDYFAPALGLAIGFLTPMALLALAYPIAPAPDTPVAWGGWWPLFVGGLSFLAPVLIWRNLSGQLGGLAGTGASRYNPWQGYATVVLGTMAYLSISLFALVEAQPMRWLALTCVSTSVICGAWLIASSWDDADHLPRHASITGVLVFFFAGGTLFSGNSMWMGFATVLAVVLFLFYKLVQTRSRAIQSGSEADASELIELDALGDLHLEYADKLGYIRISQRCAQGLIGVAQAFR